MFPSLIAIEKTHFPVTLDTFQKIVSHLYLCFTSLVEFRLLWSTVQLTLEVPKAFHSSHIQSERFWFLFKPASSSSSSQEMPSLSNSHFCQKARDHLPPSAYPVHQQLPVVTFPKHIPNPSTPLPLPLP